MIKRDIQGVIKSVSNKIPVIVITGPRQSGKTTLAKNLFKNYKYISLEDPGIREFAINDPKGFLDSHGEKIIIDEAQYAPQLFSFIQLKVDETNKSGMYVLTGSQNFLLSTRISQSLAGRTIIFTLLPFSFNEFSMTGYKYSDYHELIFNGFYPRLYDSQLNPNQLYPSYIQSYLERDARQLINIGDLDIFQKFLKICAGRIGQIINLSAIAGEIGISHSTVRKWLSVLQASYIVYLLPPYFNNFNKRIVKTPKLYFYDSGIACSLLQIKKKEELYEHFLKGSLFESFIISELMKYSYNYNANYSLYYWRETNGNEIDCLINRALNNIAVEIKSSKTFHYDFLKPLLFWNKLNSKNTFLNLIHGGDFNHTRDNVSIWGWEKFLDNINKIVN